MKIEGRNAVLEALNSGVTVDKLYQTISTTAKENWSVWLREAGISK